MSAPVFVPVRLRGRIFTYAWIDAEDADRVNGYTWVRAGTHAIASGRTSRSVPYLPSTPMHRFILGLVPGDGQVHHINEDGFDNRKENLQHVESRLAHGALPHPRRDAKCSPYRRHTVPPHQREVAIADAGLLVAA